MHLVSLTAKVLYLYLLKRKYKALQNLKVEHKCKGQGQGQLLHEQARNKPQLSPVHETRNVTVETISK